MVKVVMPAGKGRQKWDFCTPSQAGREVRHAGRPWAQPGTENGLPLRASLCGRKAACSLCAEGTARLPWSPAGDPRQPQRVRALESIITAAPFSELPGTRACTAQTRPKGAPWAPGAGSRWARGPSPLPLAWCLLRQQPEEEGSSSRHPGERARPGASLGLAMMPALVVPGSRSQSRASSMGAFLHVYLDVCVSVSLCESVCAQVCTVCICVSVCS